MDKIEAANFTMALHRLLAILFYQKCQGRFPEDEIVIPMEGGVDARIRFTKDRDFPKPETSEGSGSQSGP